MIKFRYALDIDGKLVEISELATRPLSKSEKFYTLDFRDELIPRLGKIRRIHFALKPGVLRLGSPETYLHALGKKVFHDEYKFCLDNDRPFYIGYTVDSICTKLKKKFGIECRTNSNSFFYDLTKYFKDLQIEKRDGSYIPDLILTNPQKSEKIYIEIAVTHLSSNEKKESGSRIIEFQLQNEDGLSSIINFKDGIQNEFVKFYNFKTSKKVQPFCRSCECNKFYLFGVFNNGSCKMIVLKEHEVESALNKFERITIWNKVGTIDNEHELIEKDLFIDNIVKAYNEKVKVRNCYICRYHANSSPGDYLPGEPIFCKFRKINCGSNEATGCQFFKPDLTNQK